MTSIDEYVDAWVDSTTVQSSRYRLVLAIVGYGHEPLRTAIGRLTTSAYSVDDFVGLSDEGTGLDKVVITDLESVCRDTADGPSLGDLRDRVGRALDLGTNVILLSRYPRIRYPRVPGSSILEDAKLALPPLMQLPTDSDDPLDVLPTHVGAHNKGQVTETFSRILGELGEDVLTALDHAIFESGCTRDQTLDLLEPRILEAVCGAGLAQEDEGTYTWSIPKRYTQMKEAIGDALARMTEAPGTVKDTFGAVWSLERTLRRAIRARAVEVWEAKWRQTLLTGAMPKEAVSRATGDAYASAVSIKELRDPLEWLTLGELLDVRKRNEIGDLGLESILWKRLADEVLPVRNRLSHMRLLQEGDLAVVQLWQRVLDRKLKL